jgi:hypothetical protein
MTIFGKRDDSAPGGSADAELADLDNTGPLAEYEIALSPGTLPSEQVTQLRAT